MYVIYAPLTSELPLSIIAWHKELDDTVIQRLFWAMRILYPLVLAAGTIAIILVYNISIKWSIFRAYLHTKPNRNNSYMPTKMKVVVIALAITLLVVSACAPKQKLDPNAQIREAVAATLAAIPTYTPYPVPTSYPTPTPLTLAGLFCEYQFCIGHPPDIAFFDVSAQRNPASPSSYGQGLMAAFNANLFIEILWQHSPGTADPKFLLDLIMEDEVDTRVGNMDVKLIRDMNVLYTPITSTATNVLPFGGAAAWTCGERVFAWKAYTPQDGQAVPLFEEAIKRFRC